MTRQQITLVTIFVLFLAPVLLVVFMRSSWWGYQPEALKNHGQLVQPPVTLLADPQQQTGTGLRSAAITGKWLLLYVMPEICARKCTDNIKTMRQIHKAAGRQGQHLAIVVLSKNHVDSEIQSSIESIYQGVNLVADASADTLSALARINSGLMNEQGQQQNIQTYVVDPMLNVVLAYSENANPSGISKDLKRLLNWSLQDKTS
jgi:peroxiredoxin